MEGAASSLELVGLCHKLVLCLVVCPSLWYVLYLSLSLFAIIYWHRAVLHHISNSAARTCASVRATNPIIAVRLPSRADGTQLGWCAGSLARSRRSHRACVERCVRPRVVVSSIHVSRNSAASSSSDAPHVGQDEEPTITIRTYYGNTMVSHSKHHSKHHRKLSRTRSLPSKHRHASSA